MQEDVMEKDQMAKFTVTAMLSTTWSCCSNNEEFLRELLAQSKFEVEEYGKGLLKRI